MGPLNLLGLFVRELGIGLAAGALIGWLGVQALQRARLATAGLYPVAALAIVALAYGATDSLHGSGFLAVYLAGLSLGSARLPAERTIVSLHQGLGWVAQVAMFLTLGLLVFPSQLGDVALKGTVLAVVMMFLARPAAVVIATLPFAYGWRERIILGWAGLRGAVPVVLATFPVIAGVPQSLEFFNIAFFAVLLSTLVQGSTFEEERAIPPRGSTRLLAGDDMHLLIDEESVPTVRAVVERWHPGPIGPSPRPRRPIMGRRPIFTVWSWNEERDGDAARPRAVAGHTVIEQLRIRRDQRGGLWVLADGRYAITGPLAAIGSGLASRRVAGDHDRHGGTRAFALAGGQGRPRRRLRQRGTGSEASRGGCARGRS